MKLWRKGKDLTLAQLSTITGISAGSLSDIETQKTLPSVDTIASFVRNTEIDIRWLLTGEKEESEKEEKEESNEQFRQSVAKLKVIFESKDDILIGAIKANLHSFERAVQREQENQELRAHIERLELRMAAFQAVIDSLQQHTKKNDATS